MPTIVDRTKVRWATELGMPLAMASINESDPISLQRVLIYDSQTPGQLRNLGDGTFESMSALTSRILEEVQNGKQVYFCGIGEAAPKEIKINPEIQENRTKIGDEDVIQRFQKPVVAEKNMEEILATSKPPEPPNVFKRLLHFITGGRAFDSDFKAYDQAKAQTDTLKNYIAERKTLPLDREVAEYGERREVRNEQKRMESIDKSIQMHQAQIRRMRSMMEPEANPPEDLQLREQISAVKIAPPPGMSVENCTAFTTAVMFTQAALTNLEKSASTAVDNSLGDPAVELKNNIIYLTDNVFRQSDPRFRGVQKGIIKGRGVANEALAKMASGDYSLAGKLLGEGMRNMMGQFRSNVSVGSPGAVLDTVIMRGSMELMEQYPQLKAASGLSSEEFASFKGIVTLYEVTGNEQQMLRGLVETPPAPNSPEREELLSKLLTARMVGDMESQLHREYHAKAFVLDPSMDENTARTVAGRNAFMAVDKMPDTAIVKGMITDPKGTMEHYAQQVRRTPTFEKMMSMDGDALRNAFHNDTSGYTTINLTGQLCKEYLETQNAVAKQEAPQAESAQASQNKVAEQDAAKVQEANAAQAKPTVPPVM